MRADHLQDAGEAGQASGPLLTMTDEIIVVDDHPLYRAALIGAIAASCRDTRFLEADSVSALFAVLERHPRSDLLLLDLNLPDAYGFSALAHLRGAFPQLPVVVVSAMHDRRTVRRALALGAQGFVSKSADARTIGHSIRAVLRGELVTPDCLDVEGAQEADAGALAMGQRLAQLTPQQFRVYGMLCAGRLNKQIAHDLQITEATVKAHMTAILRKLGAGNRTQAVLLAGGLAIGPYEFGPQPEGVE